MTELKELLGNAPDKTLNIRKENLDLANIKTLAAANPQRRLDALERRRPGQQEAVWNADADVKTLIAISKELDDADYFKWAPRDHAYWATRPQSERGVRLHEFIEETGEQKGMKLGFIVGAVVVGFAWMMWG